MRSITTFVLALLAILAFASGCRETDSQDGQETVEKTPPASSSRPADTGSSRVRQGKVVETMNSGGYTYVKVDAGGRQDWYAGPQTEVAVGETVLLPTNGMPMESFRSNSLDRTFELIYFVGSIGKAGKAGAASTGSGAHGTPPPAVPATDLSAIEKAEGGMTVVEIFKAGADAAGREVVLRGKVVKFNANILGKNWLHVRDGTGAAGTNDITVTTRDSASVGDVVLVTGKLAADRDFGHGYKYALLIEDAKLVVE